VKDHRVSSFFGSKKHRVLVASGMGMVVLCVGLASVLTRAATFFAASEPESGSVTMNATIANDASASGGKVVQFHAPVAQPPTGGNGKCAITTSHVPDGPDGMGGCWPGPSNTGVPAGTQLSSYTGPCTISSGTVVIENKTISCDGFRIQGASTVVTVRNSKITTSVFNEDDGSLVPGHLTLDHVTISGITDANYSALMYINNVTVLSSNISSGQHNIQCVNNCEVRDSYLHDQTLSGLTHNNAFMTNGGSHMTLVHNTLNCSVPNKAPDGGCSSDLTLLGDFAVVSYVTADKNLFMANQVGESYCAYGGTSSSKKYPNPNNIVYTNNIFQRGGNNKCAAAGPITGFDPSRPGNVWSNNKWDDGTVLPSAL
jgi:hypothetical protein